LHGRTGEEQRRGEHDASRQEQSQEETLIHRGVWT